MVFLIEKMQLLILFFHLAFKLLKHVILALLHHQLSLARHFLLQGFNHFYRVDHGEVFRLVQHSLNPNLKTCISLNREHPFPLHIGELFDCSVMPSLESLLLSDMLIVHSFGLLVDSEGLLDAGLLKEWGQVVGSQVRCVLLWLGEADVGVFHWPRFYFSHHECDICFAKHLFAALEVMSVRRLISPLTVPFQRPVYFWLHQYFLFFLTF